MAIDIYGGDVTVIATREELMRIATQLQAAAAHLRDAPLAAPAVFLDLLPNPLPNLQLAFQLPPVIDQLDALARNCLLVAESYFSSEAQIMGILQQLFQPLANTAGALAAANPISVAISDVVSQTGAALAVIGLVTAPSLGSAQLIAQGARVVSHARGFETPAAMLAGTVPPLSGGAARLVQSAPVMQAGTVSSLVADLRANYWSPKSSIRIQEFPHDSGRTFVVMIPGTQSFVPLGKNPLDIPASLSAFSGTGSASQAAVADALSDLGAGANDRVIFVGHSQGGLIAANLASGEQDYEVAGLITLGSPVSQLNLEVPTLSVQHQQDPIPLLSGTRNPMTANWVTISSGREFSDLVQAHSIYSYADTVLEAEQLGSTGFASVVDQMRLPNGEAEEYLFEIYRD